MPPAFRLLGEIRKNHWCGYQTFTYYVSLNRIEKNRSCESETCGHETQKKTFKPVELFIYFWKKKDFSLKLAKFSSTESFLFVSLQE